MVAFPGRAWLRGTGSTPIGGVSLIAGGCYSLEYREMLPSDYTDAEGLNPQKDDLFSYAAANNGLFYDSEAAHPFEHPGQD